MGKFDAYKINLINMKADIAKYEFQLDNTFFAHIDGPEIQKGNLKATVEVKKKAQSFEFTFHCEGFVIVQCDRCLDEMEQPIETNDKLKVKFGDKFADEGEDTVIIPQAEGEINIAWYLYEFVALAVPMKHVHPAGKCNRDMAGRLKKHLVTDEEGEEDNNDLSEASDSDEGGDAIDPRWNDLKKLINNN